jgi:hypothetical protein
MTCDHQWQESGTSKKHDWVCSKCKILYTVLKGLDDDDIQTYVRPWQGLTDNELLQAYRWLETPMPEFILEQAKQELLGALRRVEAKLKERNT